MTVVGIQSLRRYSLWLLLGGFTVLAGFMLYARATRTTPINERLLGDGNRPEHRSMDLPMVDSEADYYLVISRSRLDAFGYEVRNRLFTEPAITGKGWALHAFTITVGPQLLAADLDLAVPMREGLEVIVRLYASATLELSSEGARWRLQLDGVDVQDVRGRSFLSESDVAIVIDGVHDRMDKFTAVINQAFYEHPENSLIVVAEDLPMRGGPVAAAAGWPDDPVALAYFVDVEGVVIPLSRGTKTYEATLVAAVTGAEGRVAWIRTRAEKDLGKDAAETVVVRRLDGIYSVPR